MARYLRPRIPGASIFFTVALRQRGDDLLIREIDRLRFAVAACLHARPFRIDAWVVLPDHMHTVWTLPEGDSDYARRWAAIKAAFSSGLAPRRRRASDVKRREKGIWQRRFWEHHLRHEAEWHRAIRYCWQDPVRHGLVDDAGAWPYSSIHRDLGEGRGARASGAGGVGCASAHPTGRS